MQGFGIWDVRVLYVSCFGPVALHGLAASCAARRLPRHSDMGGFIKQAGHHVKPDKPEFQCKKPRMRSHYWSTSSSVHFKVQGYLLGSFRK